jgi:hypothetical protein
MGTTKNHGGRPRIEIDLAAVERMASIQCTDEEIACMLGVSINTITRRKADDPAFMKVLEEGRGKGRATLRRLQWQRANAGSDTMLIWLGKQTLGQTDRHEVSGPDGGAISYVIRAPTPVESADEWLKLHAPRAQLTNDPMLIDAEPTPQTKPNGKHE